VEDRLVPGVSVAIPVGTHFQFRAEGEGLEILGVTVRAWPGEEEAVLSDLTPWKGGVGVKV
jgi:mannose-6-phosphate isomerase-like protein (cupin superfamily)